MSLFFDFSVFSLSSHVVMHQKRLLFCAVLGSGFGLVALLGVERDLGEVSQKSIWRDFVEPGNKGLLILIDSRPPPAEGISR